MIRLVLILFAFTALCAEEKNIAVLDGTLFTDQMGVGSPVIIVHGAPALNQNYLRPVFELLADRNKVVFYDQRGCGKSTGLNNINIPTFLNDIEAIRKDLGVEKVTLIGHSWGAFLAMNYAIQYPDSVNKLVLLSSMPASKEEFDQFITVIMGRLAPIHKELEEIESTESYKAGDPDTVEKQMKTVFTPYFFNPNDVKYVNFRLTREAFLNGSQVFKLLCEEVFFKPYDLYPQLANVKAPTLVLHGDYDPIPAEFAEHVAKTIPNARFVKFVNCGHFPYAEVPHKNLQTIKAFLAE